MLLLAQRDSVRVDAMVFSRPKDQGAPAATDIEQAFTGLEAEFSANMIEFVRLGLVEAVTGISEIGARIDHQLVEPHFVEVVRNVVVK